MEKPFFLIQQIIYWEVSFLLIPSKYIAVLITFYPIMFSRKETYSIRK